jgi:hypothetical protein
MSVCVEGWNENGFFHFREKRKLSKNEQVFAKFRFVQIFRFRKNFLFRQIFRKKFRFRESFRKTFRAKRNFSQTFSFKS